MKIIFNQLLNFSLPFFFHFQSQKMRDFITHLFLFAIFKRKSSLCFLLLTLPTYAICDTQATELAPATQPIQNTETQPIILIVGDSLSSAYGFEQSKGWVSLLQTRLHQADANYRIVNASISGETTQGGQQRLPSLLQKYQPDYVIIELGGNDGLRGLSLKQLKNNLESMITNIQQYNAITILAGIKLPPNYGQDYTRDFYQVYVELSNQYKLTFIPFLLDGVATNKNLMQEDGIHPVADAQALIRDNVWKVIEPVLK